jgi:ferric-dicitrate binding protein FerR (iron transport regulator)
MNEEIDIILARYFCGEATKSELKILDEWLAKSKENEIEFHKLSLLYQYVSQKEVIPSFDTEKALAQFKTHIHEKQKIRSNFKISNFLKVAAAIAVLLVSTFTLFYFFNQHSKTIRLIADETLVEYEIYDNTKITLAQGSEVIYHSKKESEIILKGKATFKVNSKTSATGIIVQAGETFIKDIGTIFTVDATNPHTYITVAVSEGEVWFYSNTNTGVYVKQNESAGYDVQTKQFEMLVEMPQNAGVETQHATSLQELIFQNTTLQDAIDIIKIRYGVDIIIASNQLKGICLNVSFDGNESVENIMEIISATIAAHLSKKDGSYIITQ